MASGINQFTFGFGNKRGFDDNSLIADRFDVGAAG
jgi:hypothetical protein